MILVTAVLGFLTGALAMYVWDKEATAAPGYTVFCYNCGVKYHQKFNQPDNHNCEDYR